MKSNYSVPTVFCSLALVFISCGGGKKDPPPPDNIVVAITPRSIQLKTGEQRTLTVTVTGTNNKGVVWSLEEPAGPGAMLAPNSTGNFCVYTAPTVEGTFRIFATSVADTTKQSYAEAQVTLAGAITYTDPPQGNYFRFIRNSDLSTPTHLVLDLVADGQVQCAGVAFSVSLSNISTVNWAKVAPTDPVMARNGGVFNLGSNPVGLMGKQTYSQLNAMVAQKGGTPLVNINSGVLARIALATNPNYVISGATTFQVDKFQIITGPSTVTTINPANVRFGYLNINN